MIHYATRLPPGKPVELLDDYLVRKTARVLEQETYRFYRRIINHFINYPDPMVVPVYSFLEMGKDKEKHYVYSYIMERCGVLSTGERALINTVGDLWDTHQTRACQQNDPELLSRKEQFPVLFEFLKTVVEQDRYMDLHSGNVMMSPEGTYCLIDLEGFLKWPINDPSNDWISKEE